MQQDGTCAKWVLAAPSSCWSCIRRAVVKLQSLAIKSAGAEGRAPRRVKLFINRASLGFSEAADFAPVQELELTPEQVETGEPIALKWVARAPRAVEVETL